MALDGVAQEESVLEEILDMVYSEPIDIEDIHSYPQAEGVAVCCPHTRCVEYGANYYNGITDENGKYLTFGQIRDGKVHRERIMMKIMFSRNGMAR